MSDQNPPEPAPEKDQDQNPDQGQTRTAEDEGVQAPEEDASRKDDSRE
jgi:hypothetical protein